MNIVSLTPGESFFDELAVRFLETYATAVATGDLSHVQVLVPALPMAAELRAALVRTVQRPMLLPRFDTLKHWVQSVSTLGSSGSFPESRRLVLLYEVLQARGWFDEAALWGIASEMAALFDALTLASVQLAEGEAELAAQLENAYALRESVPLAFEARVVHDLWHALMTSGTPDAVANYRLQLAEIAHQPSCPLLVLLDAAPEESLDIAERNFLRCYGESQAVLVFHPAPRESGATPLLETLDAAWSSAPGLPLFERAKMLVQRVPRSPLAGRLSLVPVAGREPEAQAAVAQVGEWLQSGLRRIALIAQDRLSARRVRALLEREGVLVSDETGWLLSTSRAAATVDALIETIVGNAYHRDLIDLCKSPYIFADIEAGERQAVVFDLESSIRRASVKAGLSCVRRALQESDAATKALGAVLLDRLDAANALLNARPAPLARWIGRLLKALDVLGALPALAQDVAGKVLLDLLEARSGELEGSDSVFSLTTWRDWLNREFEAASFRDGGIASPIVVTPLNAVCLRRFDAALLIGGGARQLAPESQGAFFNQSVRKELGLRTRADSERELRRDLELLLATVPHVTVTWQSLQNGEANLLAPEWLLLSSLHQLAWGDDLYRLALPARPEAQADFATAPLLTQMATPVALPVLIPQRVSVSAYATLVACPFRFFARHVLRLGEMEEVSEEMEKSDYGALVHRVLERFHARHPLISDLPERVALSALQACVDEVFLPVVEENFLAVGWRLRWEKRLPGYLAWQREREAEGWRWAQAETKEQCVVGLNNGTAIELYGRIDRIDVNVDGEMSLLDYKTQAAKSIRDRLEDDVQLPAYALMHGHAVQAAYVALDDDQVIAVACSEENNDLMGVAAAQGERLGQVFSAMHAGAVLPAHGVERVCAYCEMRGVCRRDYFG